jgi:peptide/nickel transport system substrate-binding protein
LLGLAVAAAVGAVGATIGSAAGRKHDAAKASGGTYTVGWESSFGFTNAFDPTGEYLGEAFAIYSNLLVRTLVGYNHVSGAAGNAVVADLAAIPKPTNGGKTYTFHLKNGIKFGPPLNREITSKDVAYAFQRLASPKDGAQYGFYYSVIKGFDAAKGKPVSGIKTPNAKTIVFNLTQPTGDFLFRVAMPAAGPIPKEIAGCFEGQAGKYGRNVVSSGPYMIDGSASMSKTCAGLKPISGYDAQTTMTLVRNPSYDPKTDSKAARENLPDKFVFVVNANSDDILNRVNAGNLQDEVSSIGGKFLRQYTTSSSLKKYLHLNSGDRTWYLTMNLTQAPFDDIHIRKAINWVMDKSSLRKAWGGPTAGAIANHIVPDTLFNNQLTGFHPYKTAGDAGDVNKAKAEIKKSKYDSNHDGTCDAAACKNVLIIADTRSVDKGMVPVIQADAAKVGITFKVRSVNGAYPVIQTPAKNIPMSTRPGWGKDYADALTFFQALFTSPAIIKQGNTNYSLIGLTPKIAAAVGASGNLKNIPSIDEQFNKCSYLSGQPRLTCFENLDKYLTNNVVPWVPYLWSYALHITSSNVTHWDFDQFGGGTAYAHVSVGRGTTEGRGARASRPSTFH